MNRRALCLLIAVMGPAAVAAGGGAAPDLGKWSRLGDAEPVIDGNAASSGPREWRSYLVSPGTFSDFRLSVEFWVAEDTNSGVFVRCQDPESIGADSCYEINIWDAHANQDFRTGAIVTHGPPLAIVDSVGKWSTLIIEANGGSIEVTLNGTATANLAGAEMLSGHIALQFGEGGALKFRNLRIRNVTD